MYICVWTESWSSGVWDQAVWGAGVLPAGGGEQSGGEEGDSELAASPRASGVSLQCGQEEGEVIYMNSKEENPYMYVKYKAIIWHDIKKLDMIDS